ncbi:SRPBCC family protein [Mycoplasmatota bacterium WC44]
MKEWTGYIEIDSSIEKVWEVINGSEENLKKLDPKIIKNEVLFETENKVGSKYKQQYKEGKKVIEYIVEVLEHKDTPNEKSFKIGFKIGKWFDITVLYLLKRVSDNITSVDYKTTNQPLGIIAKILFKLMPSNNDVIENHLKKIESLSK